TAPRPRPSSHPPPGRARRGRCRGGWGRRRRRSPRPLRRRSRRRSRAPRFLRQAHRYCTYGGSGNSRRRPMPTEAQVIEALRPVQDPELHVSIVDLDMVKRVEIDGDRVAVTVALTVQGCPLRTEITRRVTDAVAPLEGVGDVAVDLTVMTDEERHALRDKLSGGQAHAHAPGQARPIPFAEGSRTRVLGISS